ncbi:MAG: putative inorganic carbon (HCO3(-)) transporter [Bacteroidia bacterium]|jgi:putative inorganic carbon (HCO3(-)) transporter
MLRKLDVRWFYGIGLLFLAINVVCFVFDFYYLTALPLVPILLYLLFHHTDKIILFLAFATPLSIPFKDIGAGIGLSLPTEPLIVLLFFGVLFKLLSGKTFDRRILKNPIVLFALATILWLFITTLTSTHPLVSFKYTLSYTWYVLVFLLLLTHFFKSKRAISLFVWLFSIGTVLLTLYTLKNHAAESFTRLYAYTAMRPFIPDHGMYAAAISFALPPMLIIGLFGRKMKVPTFWTVVALGIALIIVAGVVFSFTRASWLSLAISFGVFALLMAKVKFKTVITVGVSFLTLFILFQSLIFSELSRNKQDSDDDIGSHLQSFSNVSTDPSNLERLNRWSCVYRMFLDKPIVGFGPGTYTYEYGVYQLPHEMSIISTNAGDLGNVHSEYLRPFAESGIIGGILWICLVLATVQQGFLVFYQTNNTQIKGLVLGALLGLITYFIHGFLNNYSEFDKIAVPMWGFISIIIAAKTYHLKSNDSSEAVNNV